MRVLVEIVGDRVDDHLGHAIAIVGLVAMAGGQEPSGMKASAVLGSPSLSCLWQSVQSPPSKCVTWASCWDCDYGWCCMAGGAEVVVVVAVG